MSPIIPAHFDGRVIVPDSPLELPDGQRLIVRLETVKPRFADLLDLAADLPGAPSDLAARHEEYAAVRDTP